MRRTKYKPKPFESTGKSADTSANIYESMLMSESFQDLSKNQRLLYICMKSRYYGHRKPKKDFPGIAEVQSDECFYFNLELAVEYGLYTRNNHTTFYNDIKAIEKHGFIKTISNGKATKTKSIYRFSSEWRNWKSPEES